MYSKKFYLELTEDTSEFDVYEALTRFGIKYARVKPLREDERYPRNEGHERRPGEGIG